MLVKEKNNFKKKYWQHKSGFWPDSRSCFIGSVKREQKGSHYNGTVTESQWQNSQSQSVRIPASPKFPIPSRKPLSSSLRLPTTQGSLDPAGEILPQSQRTLRKRSEFGVETPSNHWKEIRELSQLLLKNQPLYPISPSFKMKKTKTKTVHVLKIDDT